MPYTTTNISDKFFLYLDEDYSSYYSSAQLTKIGQKAVENVVQQKIDQFQSTKKITTDLYPLLKTSTLTSVSTPAISSNTIDITNTTLNFRSLISLLVTFSGISTQRVCEPLFYVERGDFFSTATTRYPMYRFANNTLVMEPITTAITSAEFTYFKAPKVGEFTQLDFTITSYTVVYNDKMVEEIINEMLKIASENLRDQQMFQMASGDRAIDKSE